MRGKSKISGYAGDLLFVNLSEKKIQEEYLDKELAKNFLGGPGLGAKILYDRMPKGTDPLGEDSMIGFVSGPLNNTISQFGGRYTVVCKSPVTGGWNDSNSGGFFGKKLKQSGFDAVFVNGIADKPVYIFIDNGKAEICDANSLWGLTTSATEKALKKKHGKNIGISLIGPAGENKSLISAVMNDSHRAAARGGPGAVMGSKNLKALVVKGKCKTRVARPFKLLKINIEILHELIKQLLKGGRAKDFTKYGTGGSYEESVSIGDASLKNWTVSNAFNNVKYEGYTAEKDARALSSQGIHKYKTKKYSCSQCVVGCSVFMKTNSERWGDMKGTRPEYETMAFFGAMMVNKDVESVIKSNDLCNEYGFDTISAGATITWAMECYERGIITKDELDGIDLKWGNGEAVVNILELMCKNISIGATLAKGSRKASEILGKGKECLVESQGIEIPQHDTFFYYGLGRTYMSDPTPARHVKAGIEYLFTSEDNFDPVLSLEGTGPEDLVAVVNQELTNACGACNFGAVGGNPNDAILRCVMAVTGINYDQIYKLRMGMRLFTLRQAFNIREGIKRSDLKLPQRMTKRKVKVGDSEIEMELDFDKMTDSLYNALGWSKEGIPTEGSLIRLGGLENVRKDLYPQAKLDASLDKSDKNTGGKKYENPFPYFA